MQISSILLKLKGYDEKLSDLSKIGNNENNISSNLGKINTNKNNISSNLGKIDNIKEFLILINTSLAITIMSIFTHPPRQYPRYMVKRKSTKMVYR